MKKQTALKQLLKKSMAVLSAAAVCTIVFAPVTFAAKQSPVAGTNLNFGSNDFEKKNTEGEYTGLGTPWINKIDWSLGEDDTLTNAYSGLGIKKNSSNQCLPLDFEDSEHNGVQVVGYKDDKVGEFARYYTSFYEYFYTDDPLYPKYSLSFDFYLNKTDVAYKFYMSNRDNINAVKKDGTKNTEQPYLATFDILPGDESAKLGLHTDSPQAYSNLDPKKCVTSKDLAANTWYNARFEVDTQKSTISMYVDNEFVGSYNYDAYYDSYYQSHDDISGLIGKILILGGTKTEGYAPDNVTLGECFMLFDNLSMDYIADGAFYATGVVDNNNIKVTLSDTPSQNIDTSSISVKKSDGSNVAVGEVTASGKEITIPLTNRQGGVEYVVSLPDNITDNNGNKLYANHVFVESPIIASDVEYLINEDFESEVYNWTTKAGNALADGAKLPKYAIANFPQFQKITTAYKDDATGAVSTTVDNTKNKVLQVKHNEPAACGLWFNLPEPIVSDFTLEFDYMTDYIQTGQSNTQFVASQGIIRDCTNEDKTKVLETANGTAFPVYKNYETGVENYFDNQFIFGFSNGSEGVKFGAPNFKTSNSGRYWSTTYGTGDYVYPNSQITPETNKWYNVKLDFELSDKGCTQAMMHATVKDGDTKVIDVTIPTAIALFAPDHTGVQIQSIGFQNVWNAHYDSVNSKHNVSNMYLDNLKVAVTKRTDNRVKTVTLNDVDGDDFGAVQTTSDNVISAKVQLATTKTVVSQTVTKDVIKVTDQEGNAVDFTFNGYDEETKSFDISFNKFLDKGKKYNLTIDGIYAKSGTSGNKAAACLKLPAYTAQINVTDTGKPEVKAVFKLVDSEGNEVKNLTNDTQGVKITATIKNTTDSDTTAKAMLCGYQNGLLKNIIGEDIAVSAGNYKSFTSSEEYTIDTATDAVKAFIWKDMSSFEPIAENKTIVK